MNNEVPEDEPNVEFSGEPVPGEVDPHENLEPYALDDRQIYTEPGEEDDS